MSSLQKNWTAAQKALRKFASQENKKINEWFFKTGPGQYGHGDQFIGVKVPQTRKVAKNFSDLSLKELKILFDSPIHEDRLLGIMILRIQYEKSARIHDLKNMKKYFDFFYKNKNRINNWDLVDSSAPYLSGHFVFNQATDRKKIFSLIHSKNMWDRRIAILSTFYFIRQNHFNVTLQLAKTLLQDNEDLMHKASGWMLREIGKRDLATLLHFLDQFTLKMPRTMLRYAIEKLPERQRRHYLKMS
jgi:3-methyladenine DNA glycosylase AlkD